MLNFRKHIAARLMAFLTGVIFLNMSFFLCEIRFLELHLSHSTMVENVIKSLAGVGFEEEKDSMGESAESEAGHAVDLHIIIHPMSVVDTFQSSMRLYGCDQNLKVISAKAEVSTPPPKFA